jgi:hypothetical protein
MIETPESGTAIPTLRLRLIFLAVAAALLGAALAVGISDNPPGIALAFLSSIAVVLAVTMGLRTQRHYAFLLLGSLLFFVVAAVLHNVFEAAASVAGVPWLKTAGEAIGVVFFLVAIFLCPAGIVVGLVGLIGKARRRTPATAS